MPVRIVAWLVVAALAVVGCSAPTDSPSAATGPSVATVPSALSASTAPSLTLPPGRYVAQVPDGLPDAPGGEWGMEIASDGEVTMTHPRGHTFNLGAVEEVTATRVVFGFDRQCPDQDEVTVGTYDWTWDGSELRFTYVSDSCGGRRDTITSAPWTPAP